MKLAQVDLEQEMVLVDMEQELVQEVEAVMKLAQVDLEQEMVLVDMEQELVQEVVLAVQLPLSRAFCRTSPCQGDYCSRIRFHGDLEYVVRSFPLNKQPIY